LRGLPLAPALRQWLIKISLIGLKPG